MQKALVWKFLPIFGITLANVNVLLIYKMILCITLCCILIDKYIFSKYVSHIFYFKYLSFRYVCSSIFRTIFPWSRCSVASFTLLLSLNVINTSIYLLIINLNWKKELWIYLHLSIVMSVLSHWYNFTKWFLPSSLISEFIILYQNSELK